MKRTNASSMLIFLTLGMFILSAVFISLSGANVYKSINERSENNYYRRTPLMFIIEKINRADNSDCFNVVPLGSGHSVIITSLIDGIYYETYIFVANGYLKETTVLKGEEVASFSGQNVCEADNLRIKNLEGSLYEISVTWQSKTYTARVNISGGTK